MDKVDAILTPPHYSKGDHLLDKAASLNAEFLPILGCKKLYVRDQGDGAFISGNPEDSVNFRTTHPRGREPRYEWTDRGDGVRYGVLVQDPPAPPETPNAE